MRVRLFLRREKIKLGCYLNRKGIIEQIYNGQFDIPINWEHPVTINEKLQVLKLGEYYNNETITRCCDKVLVKEYIKEKGIECQCAKTYGVYDKPKQIKWDRLPQKFVIKCNHGCGYNIIIQDKDKADIKGINKQLNLWLKEDCWTLFAEFQYRFINKKIMIEEFLGNGVITYKFYCFNGKPKIMYVSSNGKDPVREKDKYVDYYDMEFNWQNITLGNHEHSPKKIQKPECFAKMVEVATALAEDFKFVRVDLYDVGGKVFLSELTFFPTGGYMHLMPEGTDEVWGGWLEL